MKTLILGLLVMVSISSTGAVPFELRSTFGAGQALPHESGWKSGNKVPELIWAGAPLGTKSFALICDDPDAPTEKPWVHWIIFNIPATQTSLTKPLGAALTKEGMRQGMNSYKEIGYGGPFPPEGEKHRYFFKLYALDTLLDLQAGSTKEQLEAVMKNHVLGTAQLIGTYVRKKA